jgi:hypothetical protein
LVEVDDFPAGFFAAGFFAVFPGAGLGGAAGPVRARIAVPLL